VEKKVVVDDPSYYYIIDLWSFSNFCRNNWYCTFYIYFILNTFLKNKMENMSELNRIHLLTFKILIAIIYIQKLRGGTYEEN
jgi:hypothetical protein